MPVFYRVIAGETPTVADFLSHQAKGRRLNNPTPENRRLWAGVSVYDSVEAAGTAAHAFPRLGGFIAAVWIVNDSAIRWERTGKTPGHHTLWGKPSVMLAAVVRVEPVSTGPPLPPAT